MENADLLYLLAEISAVLVGFVGLTTAFMSGYRGGFANNLRLGKRYVLFTSAMLLFATLLPLVLDALLIPEPTIWKISAAIFVSFSVASRIEGSIIIRALPEKERKRIGRMVMMITGLATMLQVILTFAILFGFAALPSSGMYILMIFLGIVNTISIFGNSILPRRDAPAGEASENSNNENSSE